MESMHPDEELSSLNQRFSQYLDKIKTLAQINANLHRQVEEAYRKYTGQSYGESQLELNRLRDEITAAVRGQTTIQLRSQRADYDRQFYLNALKSLPPDQSKQIQAMEEQLKGKRNLVEHLHQEYQKKEGNVQLEKHHYEETLKKLFDLTKQYDQLLAARMANEHDLYTLKEKISFEQEYHQRRHEEFQELERLQTDLIKEFHLNEYQQIIERIREDYREFNQIRQQDFEAHYKTKLERLRQQIQSEEQKQQQKESKPRDFLQAIQSSKKEHRYLMEENHSLSDKLEQLEHDLQEIIEKNRQHYEKLNREYHQLQQELPELSSFLVHLRENAVSLWSEINTYRFLLVHLLSSNPKKKTKAIAPEKREYRDESTGFIVHIEDGLIWVRI